jgi:hypothetical protein
MTDKDLTERRVHVLPKELLERLRAHQQRKGISSEVEAVRRLLDRALQMEDTVGDILNKLKAKFVGEKDLRVLARDVLATHVLVRRMYYEDNVISFDLADGSGGQINGEGKILSMEGMGRMTGGRSVRPIVSGAQRGVHQAGMRPKVATSTMKSRSESRLWREALESRRRDQRRVVFRSSSNQSPVVAGSRSPTDLATD